MHKCYIGIDNGVTGSIGFVTTTDGDFSGVQIKTPIKRVKKYTKKEAHLNRIDVEELIDEFKVISLGFEAIALVERPMVNPTRFNSTSSALRALEATLIALELCSIPYTFIDSKEWQKALLPNNCKGEILKQCSLEKGMKLYPEASFGKMKDADGLLIAHYLKTKHD